MTYIADENEQHLITLYRENKCGDADCEGRRFAAAQTVLKGWVTHADAADALGAEAQERSLAEPATETVRRLRACAEALAPRRETTGSSSEALRDLTDQSAALDPSDGPSKGAREWAETPKFRKKPVVIEAVQYAGAGNMNPRGGAPDWLWNALDSGTAYFSRIGGDPLKLRTLEGDLTVAPNDWIIRGIKGELYPCKPDIFAATYEPASSPEHGTETDALRGLAAELRAYDPSADQLLGWSTCYLKLSDFRRQIADRLDALAAQEQP